MPLVSIIVPVFNTEKYLSECLDSIINQTLKDIEIIVVNDCTEDASEDIILDYLKKDKRISYIKHERNLGLGGARNTGIKMAKGKWVAFVDSDDYIEKGCYKAMLELADKYNADLGVFSVMNFDDETGEKYYDPFFSVDIANGSNVTSKNIEKIACIVCNKVFKLSDIVNNNIFFPEHLKHEDEEFWYKYASLLKPVMVSDENTYYNYRQRKSSITGGNISRKDFPIILGNIYNFLYANGFADEYKSSLIPKISWSYNWYNGLKDEYKDVFLRDMKIFLKNMDMSDDDWNRMDNEAKELYYSSPKLSIIIPVYNTEKYLVRCLDSIINQSYDNLDIIIINDCSSGNCDEIAEDYIKKDSRIRYKKFEKNMGTLLVRKEGALLAKGDYATYIDSDDEFSIETFNTISETLKYKKTDVVHFKSKVLFNNNSNEEKLKELYAWLSTSEVSLKNNMLLDIIFQKIPHNIWGKFYKTSILKKSADYVPNIHLINAEDLLQIFIIMYFANTYQYIDKELYVYHYELGISSNINQMTKEKYELLCKTTAISLRECCNFLSKISDGYLYRFSFTSLLYLNYQYIANIKNKIKTADSQDFENILEKHFDSSIVTDFYTYKKIIKYYCYGNAINTFSTCSNTNIESVDKNLLPYFFSIIRDDKYLTIRLFGIKISVKNKKKYYKYKIITTSTILRRIFSIYKDNNILKINLLFFKIVLKLRIV